MYSGKELQTIYETYKIIPYKSELYYFLLNNTKYLTGRVFPKQRLWHILHNTENIPLCKACNKPVKWDDAKPFIAQKYREFCSSRCGRNHPDTKAKKSNTELVRYGIGRKDIVKKAQETNLKKYGVKRAIQLDEYKKKQERTNIERYGVKNIIQNKQIQEIRRETNKQMYGYIAPAMNEDIKQKSKDTIIDKYGSVEDRYRISQQKTQQTMFEKYGIKYWGQSHLPTQIWENLQDIEWCQEQHINMKKSLSAIARELGVSQGCVSSYFAQHNIEPMLYLIRYSYKQIQWLEQIMSQEGIYIQHAGNEGEYKIPGTRYKADGYCSETNTIYEFHGDYWHGNPMLFEPQVFNDSTKCTMGDLYKKSLIKEKIIRDLGYNLVVKWESDYTA
ncbi:MAG: DUF7487 domain-containing protein [Nitrososphaeraceae archaeon]